MKAMTYKKNKNWLNFECKKLELCYEDAISMTVHYEYFFVLFVDKRCENFNFTFNCWIKFSILTAGPTRISNIFTISSFVNSSKRLPSTEFWANVSQCAAQSLIRRNWSTSETAQVSGNSSSFPLPCDMDVLLVIKHGMYLLDLFEVF